MPCLMDMAEGASERFPQGHTCRQGALSSRVSCHDRKPASCSGPHLRALVPHGLLSRQLLLQLLQVLGPQARMLGGHSLALQLLLLLLLRPLQAEQQVQAGQRRPCR